MDAGLVDLHERIEARHWWFVGRRAILDAAMARHVTPGGRIVELGCGAGGNLPMLGRHGEVMGADGSAHAVARARERTGLPVVEARLPGPLPPSLPPGRFAAVCLFDVLEHIADDVAALRAAAGLLRPGGRAVITVPALGILWSRHDDAFGHHRRYTRRGLARLVAAAGLRLRHASYFCTALLPLIAAVRIPGRLLGLEGGNDFDIPAAGVNGLLGRVLAAEAPLAVRPPGLPLGSSLLAVAER